MGFIKDESGASMVEYALVLGLIAIVSMVVFVAMGPKIRDIFNKSNREMDRAKVD